MFSRSPASRRLPLSFLLPARCRRGSGLLAALLLAGAVVGAAAPPAFVRAEGGRLVDPQGRHLILHGLNLVDKSADWTDYPWVGEAEYARMQAWGFNCVRLGFTWAEIEPQPGEYSAKAVAELRRRVDWAARHGLYVLLDMHQDLFSMQFSDGAPAWATLTDGQPHVADGKVWSDAYVTSPAVQRAMDNFYANRAGPGGIGLQDRYAGAWRFLAQAFADEPAVVGFDLMNEPFAGSLVPQGIALNFAKLAGELGRTGEHAVEGIMAEWATPAGRKAILAEMDDPARYARVLDAAEGLFQDFERTKLTPFYQKVADAIRTVDTRHLLFLETSGAANMGIVSAIEPLRGPGGGRDPALVYAPHGYDLVTDTPEVAAGSMNRTRLIFDRHDRTAARLQLPMFVGERGAYYGNAQILPSAQAICRQFERLRCSDTFWAMEKDLGEQAVIHAIRRPYPMAVVGTLDAYQSDPDRRRFECAWTETGAAGESRIYLPAEYVPAAGQLALTPAGSAWHLEPAAPGAEHRVLVVPAAKAAGARHLVVTPGIPARP